MYTNLTVEWILLSNLSVDLSKCKFKNYVYISSKNGINKTVLLKGIVRYLYFNIFTRRGGNLARI